MEDWLTVYFKYDRQIILPKKILQGGENVSHKEAMEKAEKEF